MTRANGKVSIVCFFSQPPTSRTISGGDRHALEVWSRWVARPNVELRVVACRTGAELAAHFGHRFEYVFTDARPTSIGALRLGYIARCWRALRRGLVLEDADVIWAETPFFYDVWPAVVAKLRHRGRRLIVPLYHLIPPPTARQGNLLVNILAWLEQRVTLPFIARFADAILVAIPQTRDELVRLGIAPAKIVLTRMGVLAGESQAVTSRFDAIAVGRLAPAKGVSTLLDAWACLQRERPGAVLALVGGDMPGFDVEAEISRRSLSQCVRVIRGASDAQLRDLLGASTIFISASTEEGYGLAMAEALDAGLPCAAFDIPAFHAAFPAGILYAQGDRADDLARAAERLLADAELRRRLKDGFAKQRVRVTWDDVARELWSECIR